MCRLGLSPVRALGGLLLAASVPLAAQPASRCQAVVALVTGAGGHATRRSSDIREGGRPYSVWDAGGMRLVVDETDGLIPPAPVYESVLRRYEAFEYQRQARTVDLGVRLGETTYVVKHRDDLGAYVVTGRQGLVSDPGVLESVMKRHRTRRYIAGRQPEGPPVRVGSTDWLVYRANGAYLVVDRSMQVADADTLGKALKAHLMACELRDGALDPAFLARVIVVADRVSHTAHVIVYLAEAVQRYTGATSLLGSVVRELVAAALEISQVEMFVVDVTVKVVSWAGGEVASRADLTSQAAESLLADYYEQTRRPSYARACELEARAPEMAAALHQASSAINTAKWVVLLPDFLYYLATGQSHPAVVAMCSFGDACQVQAVKLEGLGPRVNARVAQAAPCVLPAYEKHVVRDACKAAAEAERWSYGLVTVRSRLEMAAAQRRLAARSASKLRVAAGCHADVQSCAAAVQRVLADAPPDLGPRLATTATHVRASASHLGADYGASLWEADVAEQAAVAAARELAGQALAGDAMARYAAAVRQRPWLWQADTTTADRALAEARQLAQTGDAASARDAVVRLRESIAAYEGAARTADIANALLTLSACALLVGAAVPVLRARRHP